MRVGETAYAKAAMMVQPAVPQNGPASLLSLGSTEPSPPGVIQDGWIAGVLTRINQVGGPKIDSRPGDQQAPDDTARTDELISLNASTLDALRAAGLAR